MMNRQADMCFFHLLISPTFHQESTFPKISSHYCLKDDTISKEDLHNNTNQLFQPFQCLHRLQSTSPLLPWRAPPSVTRPASRKGNYTMTKDGEFELILILKMGISHSLTTACVTTRWPHCHGLDGFFFVRLVFKRHFIATMMWALFFIYRKRCFLEAGE